MFENQVNSSYLDFIYSGSLNLFVLVYFDFTNQVRWRKE